MKPPYAGRGVRPPADVPVWGRRSSVRTSPSGPISSWRRASRARIRAASSSRYGRSGRPRDRGQPHRAHERLRGGAHSRRRDLAQPLPLPGRVRAVRRVPTPTNTTSRPIGQPPASSGVDPGRPPRPVNWVPNGAGARERDAWGVPKSYGWAMGEVLAINHVASRRNEYKRNANFNQISPRSWWHNIDARLRLRRQRVPHQPAPASLQRQHVLQLRPRQRPSASGSRPPTRSGGAFVWECCGETHPMSFNDMISTGIGGMALGRNDVPDVVEDPRQPRDGQGALLQGDGGVPGGPHPRVQPPGVRPCLGQYDNPSDPMDWRPPGGGSFLALGARTIGRGRVHQREHEDDRLLRVHRTRIGNPFDNERNKPYDSFDLTTPVQLRRQGAAGPGPGRGHALQEARSATTRTRTTSSRSRSTTTT